MELRHLLPFDPSLKLQLGQQCCVDHWIEPVFQELMLCPMSSISHIKACHMGLEFFHILTHLMYSKACKSACPFVCLYHSLAGFKWHFHMWHNYTDSWNTSPRNSQLPTPQASLQVGKMPTQAQTKRGSTMQKIPARSQPGMWCLLASSARRGLTFSEGTYTRGHNKWEELDIDDMLLSFKIWDNAMKCIDKDLAMVKRSLVNQPPAL